MAHPKEHSEHQTEKKKNLTYKEATEELSKIIGTPAPIVEADSLRRQFATVGNQDAEIPDEIQTAIDDLKNRSK